MEIVITPKTDRTLAAPSNRHQSSGGAPVTLSALPRLLLLMFIENAANPHRDPD